MKTVYCQAKEYTPSGRLALYTYIQCDECGCITYTSIPSQVSQYLESGCMYCRRIQYGELRGEPGVVLDRIHREQQLIRDRQIVLKEGVKHQTHGLSHTLAMKSWKSMMDRCYNPSMPNYVDYGERGIKVCTRWHDPELFFQDMGERPYGYEIDRIDNDGDYEPNNCRYIPAPDNNKNKRKEFKRGVERKNIGWWRQNFGLYQNPYVYGPMPWKQTSIKWRRQEAIERGWFSPKKKKSND